MPSTSYKLRDWLTNLLIVSGLWLGIAAESAACSFAAGYENFLIIPGTGRHYPEPDPPEISVKNIRRGRAGGDPAMDCSDAGIIELQVPEYPIVGYRFEIFHGKFEDAVIPEGVIKPTMLSRDSLRFVWLDGAHASQEPINVILKVYAVSSFGVESEPMFLNITDPGLDRGW